MREDIQYHVFIVVATGVAAVSGSYLVSGWSASFIVVPIDAVVITTTPAILVNWTILTLGETGHYLHIFVAAIIAITVMGIGGLLYEYVFQNVEYSLFGVLVGSGYIGIVHGLITGSPVATLAALGGAGGILSIFNWNRQTSIDSGDVDHHRRSVLTITIGSIVVGIVAVGSRMFRGEDLSPPEAPSILDRDQIQFDIQRVNQAGFHLPNSPQRVSNIKEFYTVDIASSPPELDIDKWSLLINGAVKRERTISYDEIRKLPLKHEYLALRCIGENLNDRLMDTALWTGTPLLPILTSTSPTGDWVTARGADGYYETFPLSFLDDALVTYGMNGEVLPREHGFPVRLLLPDRWGKLNIKWVTRITITEEAEVGYWEDRGWEGTSPIQTVAKLWSVHRLDDDRVEIGGHAYAGRRGIHRVEVSTNNGESWSEAELAPSLPGEDVTRMWRYQFEPTGRHSVIVRAIDGYGKIQPAEPRDAFPSGASGWVTRRIP